MMHYYYQMDSFVQITTLAIILIAIILITFWLVYLLKRGTSLSKLVLMIILLIINVILYVFMLLDTRAGGLYQSLHIHIPFSMLCIIIILSLVIVYYLVSQENKKIVIMNQTSIKEAFDTLKIGVCFFNETGIRILCNEAITRFGSLIIGKEIQYIHDLDQCLKDDFIPENGIEKDGNLFILNDGSTWYLTKRSFTYLENHYYTQFVAIDVSIIQKKRIQLQKENKRLKNLQKELQKLSLNVVAMTREEEILNTKMRVHDEMGRCLLTIQQYLQQNNIEDIPKDIAVSWQRAISMLKYNNDTSDEDVLNQIKKTCESLNVSFIQKGELPNNTKVAYLLTCAVREALTNAVRYAKAKCLYVTFESNLLEASVVITNDGLPPSNHIVEGGGLSTLRRRVERIGGLMEVQSLPIFQLKIIIPMDKEVEL